MYIRAFVTADARRDRLYKAKDGTLTISVRAPAERNQANRRVLEIVAREFDVEVTQVRIFSGHRSRSKMISIDN